MIQFAATHLADEIARLSAHLHAATYRLLVLIHEFDRTEGWAEHGGFRSCAHWLSWRTGIAPGAAREKVRVARALADLPGTSEAMQRGPVTPRPPSSSASCGRGGGWTAWRRARRSGGSVATCGCTSTRTGCTW
jgi:hypothetical protein